jgi:branched-chain amino acid transport system permease protein
MSLPPRLRALLVPLAVVLVLVAGGFVPGAEQRLVTEMLVFGLFAMSLNVLLGYTGLPSLGHGLYFGLSAYATAILVRDHTENLLVILLLAPLVAAVVAALVGLIALRTSGAYFLMITFALAQLGVAFTTQASDLTGGADGLAGIFRPDLGEGVDLYDAQQFYFLVAGVVLVGVAVLAQLLRSPFGRTLTGIRENPERMQALGFNVWAHRYAAFVISGAFAGVAGVLVAYLNGFVSPDLLGLTTWAPSSSSGSRRSASPSGTATTTGCCSARPTSSPCWWLARALSGHCGAWCPAGGRPPQPARRRWRPNPRRWHERLGGPGGPRRLAQLRRRARGPRRVPLRGPG